MLLSDMRIKPLNQVIEGYNDKIVINTSNSILGKVEPSPVIPVRPWIKAKPSPMILKKPLKGGVFHQHVKKVHNLDDHEDEKQAIILAMGGLMLFVFWWGI